MPSIEKVVYQVLKIEAEEVGEFSHGHVSVYSVISTRPFLTRERMGGRKRRASVDIPQVIAIYNQNFIIDGHHKFRRAIDNGCDCLFSNIFTTDSRLLASVLYEMSHGYVSELEVR